MRKQTGGHPSFCSKRPHHIYEVYGTSACAMGHQLFLRLKKWEIDLFSVFSYRTRTSFCKIFFIEIARYPWTFWPFIVSTKDKQAYIDIFRHLLSCLGMSWHSWFKQACVDIDRHKQGFKDIFWNSELFLGIY